MIFTSENNFLVPLKWIIRRKQDLYRYLSLMGRSLSYKSVFATYHLRNNFLLLLDLWQIMLRGSNNFGTYQHLGHCLVTIHWLLMPLIFVWVIVSFRRSDWGCIKIIPFLGFLRGFYLYRRQLEAYLLTSKRISHPQSTCLTTIHFFLLIFPPFAFFHSFFLLFVFFNFLTMFSAWFCLHLSFLFLPYFYFLFFY